MGALGGAEKSGYSEEEEVLVTCTTEQGELGKTGKKKKKNLLVAAGHLQPLAM
jgi:hypothetical protein